MLHLSHRPAAYRNLNIERETAMTITITREKTCRMAQELADLIEDTPAAAVDLAVQDHLADKRMYRDRAILRREERALATEEIYARQDAITKRHIKESPPDPFERERKRGRAPWEGTDRPKRCLPHLSDLPDPRSYPKHNKNFTMPLAITDEETCRLAQELADFLGETPDAAVHVAIRGRLPGEWLARPYEERSRAHAAIPPEIHQAKIHAIIKRFNKNRPPGPSAVEISDDLYDEYGAPK